MIHRRWCVRLAIPVGTYGAHQLKFMDFYLLLHKANDALSWSLFLCDCSPVSGLSSTSCYIFIHKRCANLRKLTFFLFELCLSLEAVGGWPAPMFTPRNLVCLGFLFEKLVTKKLVYFGLLPIYWILSRRHLSFSVQSEGLRSSNKEHLRRSPLILSTFSLILGKLSLRPILG